ncbi:hypothetical protein RUND412_005923 [Rhizina undulata]
MADPFSIACGVAGFVGLIPVLIDICTKGYGMLTTARNVGEDWGDLEWRREIVEARFKDWVKEMQLQDDGLSPLFGPDNEKYTLVVKTLAKIVECFRQIDEFKSTYELNQPSAKANQSTAASSMLYANPKASSSMNDPQLKRKNSSLRNLAFWSKPNSRRSLPGPISDIHPDALNTPLKSGHVEPVALAMPDSSNASLKFPEAQMLENLPQLALKYKDEIQKAVDEFNENAKKFQDAISTRNKVRWTLAGKESLNKVINDLEMYNNGLFKITKDVKQVKVSMVTRTPSPPFQEFDVLLKLPFRRNPKFCGRHDIIDKLFQILEPAISDAAEPRLNTSAMQVSARTNFERKTVVLHGLGGTGKSQIALEYAHRFCHSYASIFWIDADDASRTTESACQIVVQIVDHYINQGPSSLDFPKIAKILGIAGQLDASGRLYQNATDVAIKAVHTWLSAKENRRWLLLVDNHDKIELSELEALIPTCDWGTVIVTTRLPNLHRFGECVEVEGIGAEPGLELLLKSSGKKLRNMDEPNLGEARAIVRELGELPLALDQAGAYVSSLQIPFSDYRNKLKKGMKFGFSQGIFEPSLSSNKTSVLTTWELSFQELNENARHLLHLCAFLSNEDIPVELFRRGNKAVHWIMQDETQLDHAFQSLLNFSLVRRKESGDSFWMHPLVHAWAREHTDSTIRRQNAEVALRLVASATGTNVYKMSPEDWIFERRILSHLNACRKHIVGYFGGLDIVLVSDASYAISEAYMRLGYYKEAEALHQMELSVHERINGKAHLSTMHSVYNMAVVFYRQGRYQEALEYFQRALAGYEKVLGKDHPSTLDTVDYVATVFQCQERYDEALEWHQRARAGYEKALGNDHPSTLVAVTNVASIFRHQGRYDESLELHQMVLAEYEKTLGNNHPSTLGTMNNIAMLFKDQGRHNEALELYQSSLAGKEKTLGKEHSSTIDTVCNLALLFGHQKRYEEALNLYQRALAGYEKVLGKNHPSTLDTMGNIAMLFKEQGRHNEALELYQSSLAGKEKTLGKAHSSTIDTVYNLALLFGDQKRYEEALNLYQKALAGYEKVLGKSHPSTLDTVDNMTWIFRQQERFDEAKTLKQLYERP